MTLDEAEAHIGNPVLIHDLWPRVHEGEIVAVDMKRRYQVKLRVRRKRAPYAFLPTHQWWPPSCLSVPQWWLDRQEVKS